MIIDLDSHLREYYFMDEVYKLPKQFREFQPRRLNDKQYQRAEFSHALDVTTAEATHRFRHDFVYHPDENWQGGEVASRQVGGWNMGQRLEDNAREGIDRQVLFPTRIVVPTQYPGEVGAALATAYNNWVYKLVEGFDGQFLPVAMAPAGHPVAMEAELRRCVKDLGFKAAHLVSYSESLTLSDQAFDTYFRAAEELDVPLFCHPNTLGDNLINRADSFFSQHVLGRPLNVVAALIALVCGGIFERHPHLRVCFFEVSAEFPLYWMHRMDEDWEWAKLDKRMRSADLSMPPSEYVKRNCYFTCEADEPNLGATLEAYPVEHVLMASDYPHFDSEWPDTVSGITERSDLTDRQKELILGVNAAELLHLE